MSGRKRVAGLPEENTGGNLRQLGSRGDFPHEAPGGSSQVGAAAWPQLPRGEVRATRSKKSFLPTL